MKSKQHKIVLTDGTETVRPGKPDYRQICEIIGCNGLDIVTPNRHNATIMFVDDTGMIDEKPVNAKATALYRANASPEQLTRSTDMWSLLTIKGFHMADAVKTTPRGFGILQFKDRNGNECSLQKSSLAFEDCVWLGCNEIELKRFTPGKGWEHINLEQNHPGGIVHTANTRMHLSQSQVREILPFLQRSADPGEL
jgi:hypothetical protein